MAIKLEIKMSIRTDDETYLERYPLISLQKYSGRIFDGDTTIGASSILEFLNRIKADKSHYDDKKQGRHEFTLEWKPDDKHKSRFSNLKGKRPKDLSIFLYFWLREDGKMSSSQSAQAKRAGVIQVSGKGNVRNANQIVLIRSYEFVIS